VDPPVIVAVPLVRVVQVPADQIIEVIAVRDAGVTAPRAVDMGLVVRSALMRGRAGRGVGPAHRDHVLVDVIVVDVVQVAVVQVVDVPLVPDGGVPAPRAVDVRMGLVRLVLIHRPPFGLVERRLTATAAIDKAGDRPSPDASVRSERAVAERSRAFRRMSRGTLSGVPQDDQPPGGDG
jgi:hypothetical protein